MDTSDESFMEHTEKVVVDMLKYVLAPNDMRTDDSVEFVIIDETEVAKANANSGVEATEEPPYMFNMPGVKMSNPGNGTFFNEVLDDIELFLAQGLDKIRAEYPMYAEESMIPYLCNNGFVSSMPQQSSPPPPSTGGYNFITNAQTPISSNWFVDHNTNGSSSLSSSSFNHAYQIDAECAEQPCVGELWNDEDEWPIVGDLPKRSKRMTNDTNATHIQTENNGDDGSSSEEEDDEETEKATKAGALRKSHRRTKNQNGVAPTNQHYAEYTAANHMSRTAAATANAFQLSQTALHQTHSTTTTTTAFGVVHQQTSSSTTTNFVSNNLANAALATTPAALYAQALLAQQYWSTILKDAQQRQNLNLQAQIAATTNSNNNNNTNQHNGTNNINTAFAYVHLLQQQIINQQKHAAVAALLHQQSVALQNNIATAAAGQATNATNLFAQATTNGNAFANLSLTNSPTSSPPPMAPVSSQITATTTMNLNMHVNTNLFANVHKNETAGNTRYKNAVNNSRRSNNCTGINSNLSLDLLNLNVVDHEERQNAACPGIVAKVSQSSRD